MVDVGMPYRWIPLRECYEFWKTEIHPHLGSPQLRIGLDDFADGYCYLASEWNSRDGIPIIVCEKYH